MASRSETHVWADKELSRLLSSEYVEAVTDYILLIEDDKELEDYVIQFLGEDTEAKNFVKELVSRRAQEKGIDVEGSEGNASSENIASSSTAAEKRKQRREGRGKQTKVEAKATEPEGVVKTVEGGAPSSSAIRFEDGSAATPSDASGVQKRGRKKKQQVYSLHDLPSGHLIFPGRKSCGCLCKRHPLVNNCLRCGRIVCEQEGEGPCLTCGEDVRRSEATEGALAGPAPVPENDPEARKRHDRALALRNRLVDYDRTAAKRSTVIDDQADYYDTNSVIEGDRWLTAEERERLRRRNDAIDNAEEEAKRTMKLSIDLFGRTVTALSEEEKLREAMGGIETAEDILREGEAKRAAAQLRPDVMAKDSTGFSLSRNGAVGTERDARAKEIYQTVSEGVRSKLQRQQEEVERAWRAREGHRATSLPVSSRVQHSSPFLDAMEAVEDAEDWEGEVEVAAEEDLFWGADEDITEENECLDDVDDGDEAEKLAESVALLAFDDDSQDIKSAASARKSAFTDEKDKTAMERWQTIWRDSLTRTDEGYCLSLHQPWASLCVEGIKTVEGRSWYTEHRGPLWIAAAAKIPSMETIEEVEHFYSALHRKHNLPRPEFPAEYPVGVLLGRVCMVDCVEGSSLKKLYNESKLRAKESDESSSPFCFILRQFERIPLPIRMKGEHKIFRLDRPLWRTAVKSLRTVDCPTFPLSLNGRSTSTKEEESLQGTFDLWGTEANEEAERRQQTRALSLAEDDASDSKLLSRESICSIVASRLQQSSAKAKVIGEGIALIKKALPLSLQQRIVNECREKGTGEGGMYVATYEDGSRIHTTQMCLGLHWNPRTSRYETQRSNFDGASVPPIGPVLSAVAEGCLDALQTSFDRSNTLRKGIQGYPSRPADDDSPTFDLCLVNYYSTTGKMGLHRDKEERPQTIKEGYPVLSISIGDAAEFLLVKAEDATGTGLSHADKITRVKLESGDVLSFGGHNRLAFHGVGSVYSRTAPSALIIRPGRLNLTFRRF